MVRIRMRRVGARRQPYYRIVVADQRKSRNGRFIEEIGHYDPRTEPETVRYNKERVVYWLSNGAQPSDSVKLFLKRDGIYEALDRYHEGTPIEELFADAADDVEEESAPAADTAQVEEDVEAEEAEAAPEAEASAEEEAAADEEVDAEEAEVELEADAEAEDAEEEEGEADAAEAEDDETEDEDDDTDEDADDEDDDEDDETA